MLLLSGGCEKPIEEDYEDKVPIPKKFDLSGIWELSAWFPLDCPNCTEYRYDITRGSLLFDATTYDLNIYYTYNNHSDSIEERGTFVYSSYYFVSWYGESSMFLGEILFTPPDKQLWSVNYRTGRPPNQYDEIIFKDFVFKNDSTTIMMYWDRKH